MGATSTAWHDGTMRSFMKQSTDEPVDLAGPETAAASPHVLSHGIQSQHQQPAALVYRVRERFQNPFPQQAFGGMP